MKKKSTAAVLSEILDELEANRVPGQELIKSGRAALKGVKRSLKAATAAAKASGNSGAPRKFDEDAIGVAEGTAQEVAERFGCSVGLVYLSRTKAIKSGKRETGRRRKSE